MVVQLTIIVVGGGVCGLACAIALRRAGHLVTIYERHQATDHFGAGIVLQPNAARVLKQWGLDLEEAGMSRVDRGFVIDGQTRDVKMEIDYGNEAHVRGESLYGTTRRDLTDMLRREASSVTTEGQGSIQFADGRTVVDYDHETPALRFSNGTWQTAALVIACDGIGSQATKHILGDKSNDYAITPTDFSAFRLVLTSEQFQQSGITSSSELGKSPNDIWFAIEYPAASSSDNEDSAHAADEWVTTCSQASLLAEIRDWHPIFHKLVARVDHTILYKICTRSPLQTLHKGRLCILGDALHPMPPYRAQGGSQSIEDAGALEMCLSSLASAADELQSRLEILDRLRIPRVAAVQLVSEIRQDEPDIAQRWTDTLEDCRGYFQGHDQAHLASREAFNRWLYQYDVRQQAAEAVARRVADGMR